MRRARRRRSGPTTDTRSCTALRPARHHDSLASVRDMTSCAVGFIAHDDRKPSIFVHKEEIEMDGFRKLAPGQMVSFAEREGERIQAVSVRLLSAPSSKPAKVRSSTSLVPRAVKRRPAAAVPSTATARVAAAVEGRDWQQPLPRAAAKATATAAPVAAPVAAPAAAPPAADPVSAPAEETVAAAQPVAAAAEPAAADRGGGACGGGACGGGACGGGACDGRGARCGGAGRGAGRCSAAG